MVRLISATSSSADGMMIDRNRAQMKALLGGLMMTPVRYVANTISMMMRWIMMIVRMVVTMRFSTVGLRRYFESLRPSLARMIELTTKRICGINTTKAKKERAMKMTTMPRDTRMAETMP